ncbi:MAG: PAS domain-containing sensor histidine kinase [Ginsengibacter sp.]
MLSAIVQSADDAIISRDIKGTITSWNPSAEKIFGYSAEEANGKHISLIIPDEYSQEEERIIHKIKNGLSVQKYVTIRKRKDGTRFFSSHIIAPVKDRNKKVIGASKIISDISNQKNFYASIVNTSDDAICSKSLEGIITTWNFGAEKMFGYKEEEVLGKRIDIVIPKSKMKEEAELRNKIRKGERIAPFETVRVRKDGSQINISLTISPIHSQDDEIIGVSIIAKDISKRIEIDEQHQLYTEKLEELNKYRDDFIAMASHELKTPLTVIKANLQLLEETIQSNENEGFIKNSNKQVDKLTRLITHLLDVSAIEDVNVKLAYETFDFKSLLKDVIDNLQPGKQGHKIVIKKPKRSMLVCADRIRLENLLNNLLLNAIKYSREIKTITVETSIEDNWLQVCVKDNGIGIPNKDLEKIFDRFYRVPGIPSTYSGTGIGLFICSKVVRWHGGKIWAESVMGKGSTFHFRIPTKMENDAQAVSIDRKE